jgi:2-succinyl-5-enolpyruvyl-6-hydroxy-3-cyclohexene-1-carboxylate synthase
VNLQTEWARLLIESLRAAGAGPFVISPGSRSTPLVCAIEAAGAERHVIIDERSSGFFALGRARVTGRPAVLVCTSGSAGAHYLPAVIEAAMARVPLIAITADRPPELHRCGAPQTIEQGQLFGRFARASIDLGTADPAPASLRGLRRTAFQAVVTARGPEPGPVHLNAPARKPLEPAPPVDAGDHALVARVDALLARPMHAHPARPEPGAGAVGALAARCRTSARGVIVAGPAPLGQRRAREAVRALARVTGYPLLAEASSQLRLQGRDAPPQLCDAFDLIALPAPELIVQLGAAPTSTALNRYLAAHIDRPKVIVGGPGWSDPDSAATELIGGEVGVICAAAAAALDYPGDPSWLDSWLSAGDRAWAAVEALLAAGGPMREGQAVRAAVAAAPSGALLALGNSLPIRTVDTYCPGRTGDLDVWCQRGANGIDGLVSGVAGAATGDRPVVALLGDVSFAHDLGGLAAARIPRAPLVLVVIDNAGGRIFEQLPVATGADRAFEELWLTPPALDLEAAAATYGHRYLEAENPAGLSAAIAEAGTRSGCTIVRAPVVPDSAAADLAALRGHA